MNDVTLRNALTRLAATRPELRAYLVPLLREAAVKMAREDSFWRDGDPSAPSTPWGPAQSGYKIIPGVWVYGTAGHGGMMVSRAVAMKHLSAAAIKAGAESWGGAFWFEEDSAINIPLFEKPEWHAILARKAGGSTPNEATHERMERSLRTYHPRYFQMMEQGATHTPKLGIGDKVSVTEPVRFRDGFVLTPNMVMEVEGLTRAKITLTFGYGKTPALVDGKPVLDVHGQPIEGINYTRLALPMRYYDEGKLVKV